MRKFQLKDIFLFFSLFWGASINAQNVAINTTGATAVNSSVLLDLSNNLTNGTAGFLAPYAALTATNAGGPIATPSAGLIVYNTATAGASPHNVIPGYYYWDGTQWQLIVTGSGSTTLAWTILGNAGTNPASNFLGTTDANDLILKANSTEGLRVTSVTAPVLPRVGINDATPGSVGSAMLELKGTNGSQYGPHVQYITSADIYPVSQVINWTHDNASISWDSYWDGPANQWRSASSSASAFQIVKLTSKFWIRYAATLPAGTGPEVWDPGFVMTATGLVALNATVPQENLSVNAGANIDQGNTDDGILSGDPNVALTFGSLSGEGIGSKRIAGGARQYGLDIYTGYAERATILNNGNLGVGDTVPTTLLQVGGGTATGKISVNSKDYQFGQVQIGNPASDSEASLEFISGVTAFGDAISSTNGTSREWNIGAGTYFKGGNKFIISNVAAGPIMTFTSAGQAGIGTFAPNRILEIGGTTNTVRIDGLTTAGTFYSTNTAPTVASSIMFANNTTGDIQALAPSATNGQVLTQTATGPAWQSMGALNNEIVLTTISVSPYTPSAGTKSILVKLVGGGGGGGGVAATVHASTEDALTAGGGGAGGYCEYYIASVGASYIFTVGTAGAGGAFGNNPGNSGGSTTFNGTVTASGGAGGTGSAATAGIFFNSGGTGGAAAGGTVNIQGQAGGNGVVLVNSAAPATSAGGGGSSLMGAGGVPPYVVNTATPGNNATGYGSGGSGANSTWTGGGDNGTSSGGNGSAGVIIIYEYK